MKALFNALALVIKLQFVELHNFVKPLSLVNLCSKPPYGEKCSVNCLKEEINGSV